MFTLLARKATSSVRAPLARSFHSTSARFAAPLVKVTVDGKEIDVPGGFTVFQACEAAGVWIPRFCYHDRLSIAGNCRMCLVEVEKSPKPVASCAMPLTPGMKIKTTTPLVKKAREGVMEFLLANHPLDCPICDQGGECDLQDQSMYFGTDKSRFREIKRTVEDKDIGPLIKTVMTRCIHCTRCIRFVTEVGGVPTLGATGRGNIMEIGTYVDKVLDTELSGNIIDLCPVGALTSKPFAFTARPWELLRHESICVHDALGAHIRVDTRGPEVMRILPRLNEEINEEWLGDKSRFSYDGLKRQRLDAPMIRTAEGEFKPITWSQALDLVASKIRAARGNEIRAFVGDHVDAEGITAMRDLMHRLGSPNTAHVQQSSPLSSATRSDYLFNSRIVGIEESDLVILVGTNPRMESPILAARIRKGVKQRRIPVYNIGPEADIAMDHTQIATGLQGLDSKIIADELKNAKKPMIIVGMGALSAGSAQVVRAVDRLVQSFPHLVTPEWNGINFLHTSASRVAAMELGFTPGVNAAASPKAKVVYLLGAEEVLDRSTLAEDVFIVYQGSHGDSGAEQSDLVLPSPAFTEKQGTYLNMEGRLQRTQIAVGRLANAREDWAILRALSEILGKSLPYNTLEQVRQRMQEISPVFGTYDLVEKQSFTPAIEKGKEDASESTPAIDFPPYLSNYFQTDPICRASKTMAKASATLPTSRNSYRKAMEEEAQRARDRAYNLKIQQQNQQKHSYA